MGREGIVRERRILGAADQIICLVAVPFEQEVGLGDGIGLGVDLLAVEMGRNLLPTLAGNLRQRPSATVSIPPVPQAPS